MHFIMCVCLRAWLCACVNTMFKDLLLCVGVWVNNIQKEGSIYLCMFFCQESEFVARARGHILAHTNLSRTNFRFQTKKKFISSTNDQEKLFSSMQKLLRQSVINEWHAARSNDTKLLICFIDLVGRNFIFGFTGTYGFLKAVFLENDFIFFFLFH